MRKRLILICALLMGGFLVSGTGYAFVWTVDIDTASNFSLDWSSGNIVFTTDVNGNYDLTTPPTGATPIFVRGNFYSTLGDFSLPNTYVGTFPLDGWPSDWGNWHDTGVQLNNYAAMIGGSPLLGILDSLAPGFTGYDLLMNYDVTMTGPEGPGDFSATATFTVNGGSDLSTYIAMLDNINNTNRIISGTINQPSLLQISNTPEPSTMLLFGIGLIGLAGTRARRWLRK